MNIGIVVPHLGLSQIGFYAIHALNELIIKGYQGDAVLFFEQITTPVIQPQCGVMCINEMMSFKGTFITNTLTNTGMTLARNSRSGNKIIFYVWDLEWLRLGRNNYLENFRIFNQVDKIVARSQQHARAISNYCNRNVDLVSSQFNIDEIIK